MPKVCITLKSDAIDFISLFSPDGVIMTIKTKDAEDSRKSSNDSLISKFSS